MSEAISVELYVALCKFNRVIAAHEVHRLESPGVYAGRRGSGRPLGDLVAEFFTDQSFRAIVPTSVEELLMNVGDSAEQAESRARSLDQVAPVAAAVGLPQIQSPSRDVVDRDKAEYEILGGEQILRSDVRAQVCESTKKLFSWNWKAAW